MKLFYLYTLILICSCASMKGLKDPSNHFEELRLTLTPSVYFNSFELSVPDQMEKLTSDTKFFFRDRNCEFNLDMEQRTLSSDSALRKVLNLLPFKVEEYSKNGVKVFKTVGQDSDLGLSSFSSTLVRTKLWFNSTKFQYSITINTPKEYQLEAKVLVEEIVNSLEIY